MPNEERKWRAYKQAVIDFNGNIIPKCTEYPYSNNPTTGSWSKGTNEYGKWTISSNHCQFNPGLAIDGVHGNNYQGTGINGISKVTLAFPGGIAICPTELSCWMSCVHGTKTYIAGWNPDNPNDDKWETLSPVEKKKSGNAYIYTYKNDAGVFYTKLLFNQQVSSGSRALLDDVVITKGRLKRV
jgi:hypothetical protein